MRRWGSGARGLLASVCLTAAGCGAHSSDPPSAGWLAAGRHEQREQLERQLRGFDAAMMEVGHRYIDLYWAGRDRNWEAASYELQKMRLAIENGLERRPKRAASARPFLAGPLAAVEHAVTARDPASFAGRFAELTAACNDCHTRERVPFFEIRPPESRVSPIRGPGRD